MQRYAGDITQDEDRPRVPMLFDGWSYVPLDIAAQPVAPVKPDPDQNDIVEPPERPAR